MLSSTMKMIAIVMIAAFLIACDAPAPTVVSSQSNSSVPARPATGAGAARDSTLQAPDGWISEQPSSTMRVAQYRLPGDAGDANLAVYYFGPGQGGSGEGNPGRWVEQVEET